MYASIWFNISSFGNNINFTMSSAQSIMTSRPISYSSSSNWSSSSGDGSSSSGSSSGGGSSGGGSGGGGGSSW